MNFQQLRFVRAAARHGFNLTEVGLALHTTQSGVSKCIRELETEMGVDIFVRHGRRIVGWTPAGQALAAIADRILDEADAFKACARAWRTGGTPLDVPAGFTRDGGGHLLSPDPRRALQSVDLVPAQAPDAA